MVYQIILMKKVAVRFLEARNYHLVTQGHVSLEFEPPKQAK